MIEPEQHRGPFPQYDTGDFPAADLQAIDGVCEKFEKVWISGKAPDLGEYLNGFDGELRSALFVELLLLDIEYRTRAGQTPDAADYETRFPRDTPAIESVFRSTLGSGSQLDGRKLDYAPAAKALTVNSHFQLCQFHARGGLGTVYIARDQDLGRNVAVKFSRRRKPSSMEQTRLAREATITGRLEHPGIVAVYATGKMDNGTPCYVMQLVDGQTLQEAISRFHEAKHQAGQADPFGTLSFRQLLQRFISVCNTVAYAHDHQVIHRDIKPANIMLGRFGETFLLDWGLAKVIGESEETNVAVDQMKDFPDASPGHTLPGQPIGTPAYASPEQVSGDVDLHGVHSDVYSLGATLYCLLAGKGPVGNDGLTVLNSAAAIRNIAQPRDLVRTIPRQLEAICLKAMALEPTERYTTAQDLACDLERFLADEPVTAAREPWLSKTRRWGRKHPMVLTGAAASVLVALFSLAVGSYVLGNKNHELHRSNTSLYAARMAQQSANAETLIALRSLTDEIIERSLSRQPILSDEDREFMENVIQRYSRLAGIQADRQKELEVQIEGLFRVGQLKNFLGQKQEALDLWDRAIALNPSPSPDVQPVLVDLIARTHSRIGLLLLEFGETQRAAVEAQVAVDLMSQLFQRYPESNDYAITLARSYSELGVVQKFRNHFEESARASRESLNILTQLEKRIPDDRYVRQQLASDYSNLGTALRLLDRFDEAEPQFAPSLAYYNQLVTDYPLSHMYKLNLARVHLSLAALQRHVSQFELASSNSQSSIDLAQSLFEAFPVVPDYCYQLGLAHFEMGRILQAMNRSDQALEQFEIASEKVRTSLVKTDGDFRYRQSLLQILLQTSFLRQQRNEFDAVEPIVEESMELAKQQLADVPEFSSRLVMARVLITQGSMHVHRRQFADAINDYTLAANEICEFNTDQQLAKSLEVRQCIQRALGNAQMNLKNFQQAADHWRQAFDLSNGSDTSYCVLSAFCLANANPLQALDAVREYEQLQTLSPPQIFNLACAAAVVAKTAEDENLRIIAENKALELLERASKKNYFQDSGKIKKFRANESFSSLREHPQFLEFVNRVENAMNAID